MLMLSGCSTENDKSKAFTHEDKNKIGQIINAYQEGWLSGDSARIIELFADTAVLIPSGMTPIRGKHKIIEFWWPSDGSTTTINRYEIEILEIGGDGDWAYTLEHGTLSWSYRKQDFSMSKDQQSYEITLFKKIKGQWKIVRRIWTDLKT